MSEVQCSDPHGSTAPHSPYHTRLGLLARGVVWLASRSTSLDPSRRGMVRLAHRSRLGAPCDPRSNDCYSPLARHIFNHASVHCRSRHGPRSERSGLPLVLAPHLERSPPVAWATPSGRSSFRDDRARSCLGYLGTLLRAPIDAEEHRRRAAPSLSRLPLRASAPSSTDRTRPARRSSSAKMLSRSPVIGTATLLLRDHDRSCPPRLGQPPPHPEKVACTARGRIVSARRGGRPPCVAGAPLMASAGPVRDWMLIGLSLSSSLLPSQTLPLTRPNVRPCNRPAR